MTASSRPRQGEVWTVSLDPTLGRERSGFRPALVVSVDRFNLGPSELAIIVPLTTKDKGIPLHVRIVPPEGGLPETSFAKPEDVRSVSTGRLDRRLGRARPESLARVQDALRVLLGI